MSRFAMISTRPYQDRAIINLNNISIVTTKTELDGTRSVVLQMVDGSRLSITASLAEMQQALGATPLAPAGGPEQRRSGSSVTGDPADQLPSAAASVG